MGMSVDGLITGMSTTDTVAQLMQVEALPQTALKTKVTLQTNVNAAYLSINSRMASLVSAAQALGSDKTWGSMKATSNSDAALVSAQPGAAAGSLTFRVEELAATHTLTYPLSTAVASASTAIMSETTFDITVPDGIGTKVLTLTPKDMSLQSVVAAINGSSEAPYKAAAVQIGPGKYTLQLTAKQSGLDAGIAFEALAKPTGLTLDPPTVTFAGADARITIGDVGDGGTGYEIFSKSNTFADLLPGVTVTATRKQAVGEAGVTIGLGADSDGIAAKVQALVDNANVALTEIAAQTKNKNGSVAAGPLAGDSAMRKLSQDILNTVAGGVRDLDSAGGDLDSLKEVGIGLDRYGKLTFSKGDFTLAYNKDPARTQKFFDSYVENDSKDLVNTTGKGIGGKFEPGWDGANGLARTLELVGLQASVGVSRPTDGTTTQRQTGLLDGLIQRRTASIKTLNDQVSAWDTRLDLRKAALQKQFSNLEVAMGKMQQQSSWLAGQLASLS